MAVRNCIVRKLCETACENCWFRRNREIPPSVLREGCAGCYVKQIAKNVEKQERYKRGSGKLPEA